MKQIILIFQIIISLFLIIAILLQAQGTGLGKTWGAGGEFYRSKRGAEKILLGITVVLAILFFLISIISVLI